MAQARASRPAGDGRSWFRSSPGLWLAVGVAVVASIVGRTFPIVGAPVTGIVIGLTLATIIKPGALLRPGIAVASTTILQASVVVLGSQFTLIQVVRVGLGALPVMLGTLSVALVAAYWIGRWLGVNGNLRTLIGVGPGICGASAIAAVTPVIGPSGSTSPTRSRRSSYSTSRPSWPSPSSVTSWG